MKYSRRLQKGFTLIETLVAITILVTAVVGPITLAAKGLQSAFYAREHLTAVYLAQEALELVRERRDEYSLQHIGDAVNDDWFNSVIPNACVPSRGGSGCDVDSRSAGFIDCAVSSACHLLYDANGITSATRGIYTHVAGANSLFTRKVTIEPSTANGVNEVLVTVQVSWQANLLGGTKTVTIQTTLFNQYNAL